MQLKICKNCRRLFNYFTGPELCSDCMNIIEKNKLEDNAIDSDSSNNNLLHISSKIKEEEEQYKIIKHYVEMHPNDSIMDIAKANNIPAPKILDWVREERLCFSDNSKYAWFSCSVCGTKINSGTLCFKCKDKMK